MWVRESSGENCVTASTKWYKSAFCLVRTRFWVIHKPARRKTLWRDTCLSGAAEREKNWKYWYTELFTDHKYIYYFDGSIGTPQKNTIKWLILKKKVSEPRIKQRFFPICNIIKMIYKFSVLFGDIFVAFRHRWMLCAQGVEREWKSEWASPQQDKCALNPSSKKCSVLYKNTFHWFFFLCWFRFDSFAVSSLAPIEGRAGGERTRKIINKNFYPSRFFFSSFRFFFGKM